MTAVYLAAGFAILVWGGTAIVTKIAVSAFDPILVGVLRSVFAGIALLPIVTIAPPPRPPGARGRLLLLASALTGFVFFPLLFALGLQRTTASHTGLIMASQPIFTGLVAFAVERRMPSTRWALGCAIALLGEVMLIGYRVGFGGEGGLLGDLLILLAGFSASAGYVAGSYLSRGIGTWATTAWGNFLGGVIMLVPLALLGRGVSWGGVDPTVWLCLLYLALCSSIIAYIAWYWALTKGGIARIGLAQFANPVITVVLAILILGEPLTLELVASGFVILSGIWLAQKR